MKFAPLLFFAWLATLAVAVVLTESAGARPPRAAQILMPEKQTWICPTTPRGRMVVGREVCFILHWPEPTI